MRTIRDVMRADPISIGPEATLHEAIELLIAHDISGLPVVDRSLEQSRRLLQGKSGSRVTVSLVSANEDFEPRDVELIRAPRRTHAHDVEMHRGVPVIHTGTRSEGRTFASSNRLSRKVAGSSSSSCCRTACGKRLMISTT